MAAEGERGVRRGIAFIAIGLILFVVGLGLVSWFDLVLGGSWFGIVVGLVGVGFFALGPLLVLAGIVLGVKALFTIDERA